MNINAKKSDLPSVVIAGRPNVGKSALFNRLIGRRVAIVHHSSGVTRDRLTQQVNLAGRRFNLIDTGGLAPPEISDDHTDTRQKTYITASIRRQVDLALKSADLVILTTDTQAGIVSLDVETADFLRRTGLPVLLAANKSDTPALVRDAMEFHRLGFPVFPVSAIHNQGIDELINTITDTIPSTVAADDPTEVKRLKVTVVGRPNVGKSSFINAVLRDERLIVSDIPGTTRDCVDVMVSFTHAGAHHDFLLTDTAGIRKTNRLREAVAHIGLRRTEQQIARSDAVILMLDAGQGPTAQDKKIARLIVNHAKGIALALNKWDLVDKPSRPKDAVAALRAEWPFMDFAPILCVSAHTGFNLHNALAAAATAARATQTQITTGTLNRILTRATAKVQPPLVKGRRLKIFYAVQTGTAPLTFTFFVNTPGRLTAAYNAYLIRYLRGEFNLSGAPIIIKLKASHTPPAST